MQRWRYHSVIIRDLALSEAKLNTEGDHGWELVSICMTEGNVARAFFKMPADESTPPPPPAFELESAVATHNPFG